MRLVFLAYLSEQNYKNRISDFEDNYSSHPNYPSLFAATDSLDYLGIENIAARVEKEQLNNLPQAFIAEVILKSKKTFVLVNKKADDFNLLDESGKRHVFSTSDFKEIWTSTIVAIEPNKSKVINIQRNYGILWFLLLLIPINIYSLFHSNFDWNEIAARILNYIGLIISFLIIRVKFFKTYDSLVSKICNSQDQNGGCGNVLKSNLFPGIKVDFSDLPIIFFLTGYISVLVHSNAWLVMGALSVLSIPILLFSIYLQIFQLKSLCKLCISVSIIIFINSIVFLVYNGFSNLKFGINEILPVFFVGVLVSVGWLLGKELIKELEKVKTQRGNLLKFKKKYSLFNYLSVEIQEIEEFRKLKGIHLGNNNAKLVLSLFISPSCGYCHQAYKDAFSLMEKDPEKIRIEIFYNINSDNKDNPYLNIIQNTLYINNNSPDQVKNALDDWHIRNISIDHWLKKWRKVDINIVEINKLLEKQYSWCKINEFNYTPVRIIENAQIPNEYDIEEIGFFFSDLINDKQSVLERDSKYIISV